MGLSLRICIDFEYLSRDYSVDCNPCINTIGSNKKLKLFDFQDRLSEFNPGKKYSTELVCLKTNNKVRQMNKSLVEALSPIKLQLTISLRFHLDMLERFVLINWAMCDNYLQIIGLRTILICVQETHSSKDADQTTILRKA